MVLPEVTILSGAAEIREYSGELMKRAKGSGIGMVHGITNLDSLRQNFPEYEFNSANPSREESGLPSQLIYASKEGAVLASMDHINNRTSRFMSPETYSFTSDIGIVGDTTVFTIMSGDGATPSAVCIKNSKLADDMRSFFHCLWDALPVK